MSGEIPTETCNFFNQGIEYDSTLSESSDLFYQNVQPYIFDEEPYIDLVLTMAHSDSDITEDTNMKSDDQNLFSFINNSFYNDDVIESCSNSGSPLQNTMAPLFQKEAEVLDINCIQRIFADERKNALLNPLISVSSNNIFNYEATHTPMIHTKRLLSEIIPKSEDKKNNNKRAKKQPSTTTSPQEKKKRTYKTINANFLKNNETGCCYHCGTRETPRWRTGPEGKNTLCNACGLRYAKYKKNN